MHTIREEITKWAINEGLIQSTKDWKHLTDEKVIMRYLQIINAGNMQLNSKFFH